MSTNMNQYGFLELNNSRIMINKKMLNRLIYLFIAITIILACVYIIMTFSLKK